ncbi:acyl-CoA dehydrogenase family protein [Streptomyces sp. NPDC057638]|uniref:acyl-CoA dehydrogenase family protein n=1 Tax=Streptomyces sp. NPDC057638 TaxID=3346190 RepID=UPI0036B3F66E
MSERITLLADPVDPVDPAAALARVRPGLSHRTEAIPPRDTTAAPASVPAPHPVPTDADGRRVWAALGAAGRLTGVYRDGDPAAGTDPAALGRLMADCDARFGIGTTLAICVQIATALPLLTLGGDPAARALRRALTGEAVIALAATDEGAGTDLAGLATTVTFDDDSDTLTVTGTKRWISNAVHADHHLVLARHREGGHFTNFTWVLVPADAPGVTVEAADTALFDGSGTGHLRLTGVRLPRDHVVGRVGRGMTSFASHIAVERLTGTLWAVALCTRVLRQTVRRLTGRRHGDGTLWGLESVRQRVAAAVVRVHELRALTDRYAEKVARDHDTAAAALLKASAALTVERVLADCARLQGADGFAATGAQWTRAQAALWSIGGGATEVVLSTVAGACDALLADLPAPSSLTGLPDVAAPAHLTSRSDPTAPARPAGLSGPADPAHLTSRSDPTAPARPAGPLSPTDSPEPANPSRPADPSAPTVPSPLTRPSDPTEPPHRTDPPVPPGATAVAPPHSPTSPTS